MTDKNRRIRRAYYVDMSDAYKRRLGVQPDWPPFIEIAYSHGGARSAFMSTCREYGYAPPTFVELRTRLVPEHELPEYYRLEVKRLNGW